MTTRLDGQIARRTAYALAIFPLDIVHRQTIRAMLPVGATQRTATTRMRLKQARKGGGASRNGVSEKFQEVLKGFADENWIDRGKEFVRIRERGFLLDCALTGLTSVPECFIYLDSAAEVIRVGLAQRDLTPGIVEQRRAELRAIQRLMESGVQGARWSGRGAVQFVNKGSVL